MIWWQFANIQNSLIHHYNMIIGKKWEKKTAYHRDHRAHLDSAIKESHSIIDLLLLSSFFSVLLGSHYMKYMYKEVALEFGWCVSVRFKDTNWLEMEIQLKKWKTILQINEKILFTKVDPYQQSNNWLQCFTIIYFELNHCQILLIVKRTEEEIDILC